MNTITKSKGHVARMAMPIGNHNRYFWGADSYKQAVQWVEKQTAIYESQGQKPHVRILEVNV
jgi:hypothetical protein